MTPVPIDRSPEELGRLFERVERAALSELHAAASPPVAGPLGLRIDEVGGALLSMASAIPSIVINRALGLGVGVPAREADVAAVRERYREAGVGRHLVHLDPSAEPAGLREWLEDAGYVPHRGWAQFVRSADAPPSPGRSDLQVREIGEDRAREFARIVAAGFDLTPQATPLLAALAGRPGWHLYMTFDGETPAGAAALFVHGGHGWCDWASTHPAHRRRGSQHALLCRRIAAAGKLGCTLLFTETGEAVEGDPQHSYHNIERVGFRRFAVRENRVLVRARGPRASQG
ncbi:MAG: hypothetical protein R3199_01635 [Gemmatimonadota bacterium]|nr:hypothetical protein [Gemmatimonadota bacterium]